MSDELVRLCSEIENVRTANSVGRVVGVSSGVVQLAGIADLARIGDRLELLRSLGTALQGEVLQIDRDVVMMLTESAPDGVAVGDRAILRPTPSFNPCEDWIGRIIDAYGAPLDGAPLRRGGQAKALVSAPPKAAQRQHLGQRLATGLCVLNTVLPIVEGQRVGLFAGSGIGKSQLLAQLACTIHSDVVVIALVGERGREVNDFVRKTLGANGMKSAVVVAATSDASALTRRRCAWAAMTVAEHFRESGRNVLFLMDSVTRFAEAHREIAVAGGEAPALRGYPPSVMPLITSLCERAGPGGAGEGHITAVFSVLVAGSNMDEPIADILRGVLDGHFVLNREIAERGRFPAIDVGKSVSRSLPAAATTQENKLIADVRRLLGAYEASEVMIKAGLYVEGTDPVLDQAIRIWPDLDSFFSKADEEGVASSFNRLSLILRRSVGVSV